MFKKISIYSVAFITIIWCLGINLILPDIAKSADVCPALKAGDQIKVSGKPAIYAINNELKVLYFPDGDVYKSWRPTYGGYTTITQECYDSLSVPTSLPAAINYRPGTYLVKKTTSATDWYAVLPNNTLAKIPHDIANQLYGTTLPVMTVGEIHWPHYVNRAADIVAVKPHPGMLVRVNNIVYYILDNGNIQEITEEGLEANGFQSKFIRNLPESAIAGLVKQNGTINASDPALEDVSQGGGGAAPNPVNPPAGETKFNLTGTEDVQNIIAPQNDYTLGKFILSNTGTTNVAISKLRVWFNFLDAFSPDDLSNVYIKIIYNNGQTTNVSISNLSQSKPSDNTIDSQIAALEPGKNATIEVHGNIAASASNGDINDDKLSTSLEVISNITSPAPTTMKSGLITGRTIVWHSESMARVTAVFDPTVLSRSTLISTTGDSPYNYNTLSFTALDKKVTLNSVNLKFGALGATSPLKEVYLYDTREGKKYGPFLPSNSFPFSTKIDLANANPAVTIDMGDPKKFFIELRFKDLTIANTGSNVKVTLDSFTADNKLYNQTAEGLSEYVYKSRPLVSKLNLTSNVLGQGVKNLAKFILAPSGFFDGGNIAWKKLTFTIKGRIGAKNIGSDDPNNAYSDAVYSNCNLYIPAFGLVPARTIDCRAIDNIGLYKINADGTETQVPGNMLYYNFADQTQVIFIAKNQMTGAGTYNLKGNIKIAPAIFDDSIRTTMEMGTSNSIITETETGRVTTPGSLITNYVFDINGDKVASAGDIVQSANNFIFITATSTLIGKNISGGVNGNSAII